MMDGGGLAIAVLIILGFAGFVLWAKTAHGKGLLTEAFGEPAKAAKKRSAPRRRPASRTKTPSKITVEPAVNADAKIEKKPETKTVRKPRA